MSWFLKTARLLLVVSVLGLAAAAPVRAQAPAGPVYVVQAGDTLYGIARQFGVPLDALQAANPTVDAANLPVGQALIIPGYADVSGALSVHFLGPGEALDSLMLRFGLQRATLVRLNRLVNPDRLYISQPIILVDAPDAGPPLETGVTVTAPDGAGLLSVAAAANQNPWALAAANRLAHPGALPPGAAIVQPGGQAALKALPAPLDDIQLRPLPAVQGGTLVVAVRTREAVPVTGALGDWPLTFSVDPADPKRAVALLGLYRLAEPNLYPLTITAGGARFSQALPVRAADYGSDPPLTVDPATLDPASVQPELERVLAIVRQVTPTRQWEGAFLLPSVGAIRSRFGSLRAYNGGPYDSFHGGVDFSGGEDRPITAPAPGVVVLSEPLTVRGLATIIDHGWGVFTGYWHQSQSLVQVGDRVSPGQIIGYQGATGRVTGPHLHWEVWVGGYQVEPLAWTEAVFP